MSVETILCPHCNQAMTVPLNAEKVACPSCAGHVELLPHAPAEQPTAGGEELYYEEDDKYPEKNIAILIAAFSVMLIGIGLLFAPQVSALIRGLVFALGLILGIIAIIQRRNLFGFILLALTFVGTAALLGKAGIEMAGRPRAPKTDAAAPGAPFTVANVPAAPAPASDAVSMEIKALKRKKLAALSSEVLDRVRVSSPRLQWRRTGSSTEPVANFQLINYTRHTLTEVVLTATVTSPDNAAPLLETQFNYVIAEKLEPRKNKGVLTMPKEFAPLANAAISGRIDLKLQLKIVNAMGPTGEYLIDPFTEEDAKRLAELEGR